MMLWRLRRGGWIFLAVVLVGGIAITVARGKQWVEHEYKMALFQLIADRVTHGAPDPQTAVVRLLDYVHSNLHGVGKPVDIEPQEILASGRGWCDQQANVLVQLARSIPADGRLVFLHDANGISPHSVAEVSLDGAWRVVDPLLGVVILNAEGKLATREEIANNPQLLADNPQLRSLEHRDNSPDLVSMAHLYQHEPEIFNTWRGKRKRWMDACPTPLRHWLVYALQELYLTTPSALTMPSANPHESRLTRQLFRARHYLLVGREQAAERLLQDLHHQVTDPAVSENAHFFLGQLYVSQGYFDKALVAFQGLLQAYPRSGWTPLIHAALGQIYEALGQPALALEAYQRSDLVGVEPLVGQRVATLKILLMQQRSL